ncbi:hypothetical protein Tco_0746988 [Tanacetum coccineum]
MAEQQEEKVGRKRRELDENTNRVPSFVDGRRLRRATHHRSGHGRVLGLQSIRGPGSVGGSDVRALLQKPEPRYKVAFEGDPDGFGWFCRRRGKTIGEN